MATVTDVAAKAGVSLGTVSRVLNHHPAVSPDNVARVLRAVKEVGYVLKQPRTGPVFRTGYIGLVLLGMDRSLSSLPVIAQTVQSVQARVAQLGATTVMADLPAFDVIPPFLERGQADGLIVKGPLQGVLPKPGTSRLCDRLREFPTVWVLGRPAGAWSDHCGPDNWAIGRIAAQRLVSKGHRQLAFVSVRGGHTMFDERQAAFEWHARALGARVEALVAPPPEAPVFPLPSASNQPAMDRLVDKLLSHKPRFTGVFVPADTMAALLYRSCARSNVRIGRDLAVVSCNHEPPIIASLNPALTTIDVQADAIGAQAVAQLCLRLANTAAAPVNILTEPTLVAGESA